MEVTEQDRLIEKVEVLMNDVNKLNFDLEGLKEGIEDKEKNKPFLVRQIALEERQMRKLSVKLNAVMLEKQDADTELGAYQVAHPAAVKAPEPKIDKPDTKPNIVCKGIE
jgi:hypothetical protein